MQHAQPATAGDSAPSQLAVGSKRVYEAVAEDAQPAQPADAVRHVQLTAVDAIPPSRSVVSVQQVALPSAADNAQQAAATAVATAQSVTALPLQAAPAPPPLAPACAPPSSQPMTVQVAAVPGAALADVDPVLHEQQRARMEEALAALNKKMKQLKDAGQRSGVDFTALKALKDKYKFPLVHGRVPGISVGQTFPGKCALALIGVHGSPAGGISYKSNVRCAYAVVLSGAYKDDDDQGLKITYTGMGGQLNGRQVKDQLWATGNLALKQNYEDKVPVRVVRNKSGSNYVYEGLYNVTSAQLEPSEDGPLVCRFTLEAVPGHSAVTAQVKFKYVLNRITLAGGGSGGAGTSGAAVAAALGVRVQKKPRLEPAPPKSTGKPPTPAPARSKVKAQVKPKAKPVVKRDPSKVQAANFWSGAEPVPISVYNDVDCDSVPVIEYLADYCIGRGQLNEVENIVNAARRKFAERMPGTCGRLHGGVRYLLDGRLTESDDTGIHECDSQNCATELCRRNQVVSSGIRLPLEVFRTKHKGWGLRCLEDVPVGTFVACYIGELITDTVAEKLAGDDDYLFDLDHFRKLHATIHEELPDNEERRQLLLSVPPLPSPSDDGEDDEGSSSNGSTSAGISTTRCLTVDARTRGNVARFINHSCAPNCVSQPVFAKGARSALYYYVAFFTARDVPALEELTYDYNYKLDSVEGKQIKCHCAAVECRGRLM